MTKKFWNWRLWAAFGLSLVAVVVYGLLVMATRAIFWPCLLLFVLVGVLLVSGMRRSAREPQLYRGKVLGPVLAVLCVALFALFGFGRYEVSKVFPPAKNAPKVGERAPEFALVDTAGKNYSLAQLLATPITDSSGASHATKGVLVFFYRGYW